MKLTFVRLLVDDFPGCFRFYRDVMRLRPTYGDEHGGYADFDAGADVSLALFVRQHQTDHVGAPSEARGDKVAVVFDGDLIELNQPIPVTEAAA